MSSFLDAEADSVVAKIIFGDSNGLVFFAFHRIVSCQVTKQ